MGQLRLITKEMTIFRGPGVSMPCGAWSAKGYPLDVLQGAYIHEYGNILSLKYGGDAYKFGDKAGVGNVKDMDTGANFQRCVFPSSIKF